MELGELSFDNYTKFYSLSNLEKMGCECIKHSMSVIIGIIAVLGVCFFFITVIPFYFKHDIFTLNLAVEIFFIVTLILLLAYTIILIVASFSSAPSIHVIETILSILLAGFSLLFIIAYLWLRHPITNGFHYSFAHGSRVDAGKIEDAFGCCGWSETEVETFSANCSTFEIPQLYCVEEIQKKLFNNKFNYACFVGNGVAILCFIIVAWIEISLTKCERADYDRLELRPIKNF